MRINLIEQMKIEIENNLRTYLREEGIELYISANDNMESKEAIVHLEKIEGLALPSNKLLHEIKIRLSVMAKSWQCDALVEGIYHALQPHNFTKSELTVLLISLHVETMHCLRPRRIKKSAQLKYIVEENQ